MHDPVVRVVADEHTHGGCRDAPAVRDHVVRHRDPPAVRAARHGGFSPLAPLIRLVREEMADLDAAGAQIDHPAARDVDIRAAYAHLDRVGAGVLDGAVADAAPPRPVKRQSPRYVHRRLER
jgi:hypothetical protein